MNLYQGFRELSSDKTDIQYRQTNRLTLTDTITICGWSNIKHIHITVRFGTQKVTNKTKFHVTFLHKISVLSIVIFSSECLHGPHKLMEPCKDNCMLHK